jgi:formiminoglutamate deiminase
VSTYWCEHAWLGGAGVDAGVAIEVDGDRIATVTSGVASAPGDAVRLVGVTLPGLANTHSHAFHRALRGITQSRPIGSAPGSFWTWREQMYALAERLDPDRYLALARATYAEMVLAGITLVGEFHYLHHDRDGRPYANPNEMGEVIMQAAAEAGLRITLLDACYLHGGVSSTGNAAELAGAQRRFGDGDAGRWAERADALDVSVGNDATTRIGAAIHSMRAVDPVAAAKIAAWATEKDAPLHAHVSEQAVENGACLAAYGKTPTKLLADAGALDTRFTAVHATHVSGDEITMLGRARATCCLCPTTERDLADGVAPAARLRDAGSPLALGTDSHAVIDLFEEARAVELDERLVTGERGTHAAQELLTAAGASGHASLGWPEGGRIAAGAPADFVTIGLDSVRLAGTDAEHVLDAVVFAGAAADVHHVVVGGRTIVRDGIHQTLDVGRELDDAISALRS